MKTPCPIPCLLVATGLLASAPVWSGEPLGSTTFDGETRTVTDNGDGTRTVTRNGDPRTAKIVGVEPPPGKIVLDTFTSKGQTAFVIAAPAVKTATLASGKVDGVSRTVTDNYDGTHTVRSVSGGSDTSMVTRRPPPGTISVDDGNGGFKPYTPPPSSPVLGSTTYEGTRTTVTSYGGALGVTNERRAR
jgi:hypothetical protein